jgi:hypothetical protein
LPLRLHNLIEATEKSQCREPKDKIYGLLGLSSNIQEGTIIVDYMKPMFEVYGDVLEHTYKSDSGSAMKLSLPRFSQLLQRSLEGPFPYSKNTVDRKHDKATSRIHNSIFRAVGFIQGPILTLEPVGLDPTAIGTYEGRVMSLNDIFGRTPNDDIPTRNLRPTMDLLLKADTNAFAPFRTEDCYASHDGGSLYNPEGLEPGFNKKQSSAHPRLFSEGSGLIGLGPSTIREDDILCQFASCDIGIIVRPVSDHFRLVGRAVVARGINEKRRKVSKSSLELFTYHVPRESLLKEKQPLYFYLDTAVLQDLTFPVVLKQRRDYDFLGALA